MDFDNLSDEELATEARRAFLLGLEAGRVRSGPCSADEVWRDLGLSAYQYRRGHKAKIRQVYGAGFDIAAMMRRVGNW